MMLDFINSNFEIVVKTLVLLIGAAWTLLKGNALLAKWGNSFKKRNLSALWNLVLGTVNQLYVEEVRVLKESKKFDADAKRRIRDKAIEIITSNAKAQGIAVVKESVPVLIELAVNWLKGKTGSEGGVLPFLQGLLQK